MKKLKYKKLEEHAAEGQNQIKTSSWWVNHPGSVQMNCYSRDWLNQSIISSEGYLGEGGGGGGF